MSPALLPPDGGVVSVMAQVPVPTDAATQSIDDVNKALAGTSETATILRWNGLTLGSRRTASAR